MDSSKPFITNSWTDAGYSSVVMEASLFLSTAACAEALGKDATEDDAAAAEAVAYWLDDVLAAAAAAAAFDL